MNINWSREVDVVLGTHKLHSSAFVVALESQPTRQLVFSDCGVTLKTLELQEYE